MKVIFYDLWGQIIVVILSITQSFDAILFQTKNIYRKKVFFSHKSDLM